MMEEHLEIVPLPFSPEVSTWSLKPRAISGQPHEAWTLQLRRGEPLEFEQLPANQSRQSVLQWLWP